MYGRKAGRIADADSYASDGPTAGPNHHGRPSVKTGRPGRTSCLCRSAYNGAEARTCLAISGLTVVERLCIAFSMKTS